MFQPVSETIAFSDQISDRPHILLFFWSNFWSSPHFAFSDQISDRPHILFFSDKISDRPHISNPQGSAPFLMSLLCGLDTQINLMVK